MELQYGGTAVNGGVFNVKQLKIFVFPLDCEIKYIPLQPQNGQVLYGQLLSNPPGRERSKGSLCSGAIQTACPPASLAQLARARDL